MKTLPELAREAGIDVCDSPMNEVGLQELERFAAAVRAQALADHEIDFAAAQQLLANVLAQRMIPDDNLRARIIQFLSWPSSAAIRALAQP